MSASREKKSRQNKVEELTEKQLKAREEAARAKRNSIVYTVVGVICAVLVAGLLIWNSGFFQGRVATMKVDKETVTVAEMQYYYEEQRVQYAQYGQYFGYDYTVDAAAQMYDAEKNMTWHDFFVDAAATSAAEIEALVLWAEEKNISLSDQGKQTVEDSLAAMESTATTYGYASVNSYLKDLYGKGMNKNLYKKLLTKRVLAGEAITAYTDALNFTDEQIEQYYVDHADDLDLFSYEYAKFSGTPEAKTDDAGNKVEPTDKDKADAKAHAYVKAQELYDKLNKGGNFAKLAEGLKEDKTVTYANMDKQNSYTMPLDLAEWLKNAERKEGDTYLVQVDADCYVVQFHSRGRNEELPGDVRHILVAAEQDADAEQPTEEQYAAAKAKAEAMLAEWKAGGASEEGFAELAKAESADPGSAEAGGLYQGVSSATGFIPEFTEWVVDPARQVGDTGIVKNTLSDVKGWHILYYSAKGETPVWKDEVRTTMINEDADAWLAGLTANTVRLPGLNKIASR